MVGNSKKSTDWTNKQKICNKMSVLFSFFSASQPNCCSSPTTFSDWFCNSTKEWAGSSLVRSRSQECTSSIWSLSITGRKRTSDQTRSIFQGATCSQDRWMRSTWKEKMAQVCCIPFQMRGVFSVPSRPFGFYVFHSVSWLFLVFLFVVVAGAGGESSTWCQRTRTCLLQAATWVSSTALRYTDLELGRGSCENQRVEGRSRSSTWRSSLSASDTGEGGDDLSSASCRRKCACRADARSHREATCKWITRHRRGNSQNKNTKAKEEEKEKRLSVFLQIENGELCD